MSDAWYIVKQNDGQCKIVTAIDIKGLTKEAGEAGEPERWGPFASEQEAIARRVGLIRAGKCQPA
ncbi:MAG: hypothetical protein SFY66_17725 [Oculatellaceae cyanobacterium bins.114]|nr:hypothetical protein [Oculatellaceae cyanobacterium bins.114]